MTTADSDADGQPPATEQVTGRERLGQHHGIVQLGNHHGGHQRYPLGPAGQRTQQRQRVRVGESDPLAPAQRRERSQVDRLGPLLEDLRVDIRFHHRQGHPNLHDRDSGMEGTGVRADLIH